MIITFLPTDFISIELDRGQPRLLIDFGSGTLELKVKTKKSLDDGEWHKIDVFWDTEVRVQNDARLRIDHFDFFGLLNGFVSRFRTSAW